MPAANGLPRPAPGGAGIPAPVKPVSRKALVVAHKRVLVVDDDAENLAAICELLRLWDCDVEGAADGTAAVKAARREQPDVAIMDLGLPEGDAFKVMQQLKELGVFLIAFSGWQKAEEARAAGADAFVLKPDIETLEGLLKNVEPHAAR